MSSIPYEEENHPFSSVSEKIAKKKKMATGNNPKTITTNILT